MCIQFIICCICDSIVLIIIIINSLCNYVHYVVNKIYILKFSFIFLILNNKVLTIKYLKCIKNICFT